jgi:hypothetical protein
MIINVIKTTISIPVNTITMKSVINEMELENIFIVVIFEIYFPVILLSFEIYFKYNNYKNVF